MTYTGHCQLSWVKTQPFQVRPRGSSKSGNERVCPEEKCCFVDDFLLCTSSPGAQRKSQSFWCPLLVPQHHDLTRGSGASGVVSGCRLSVDAGAYLMVSVILSKFKPAKPCER